MAATSLAELRGRLAARPELTAIVAACSFLVDGEQVRDDTPLPPGATVDVLPPFAGGVDASVRVLVTGQVQGVGFRAWAEDRMGALGLSGSARNLPDGRVEVRAEGPRDACAELVRALRGGGPPGRVDALEAAYT